MGLGKGHVSGFDVMEAARAQGCRAPVAQTEMVVNLLAGRGKSRFTLVSTRNTELILVLLLHYFPHEQL